MKIELDVPGLESVRFEGMSARQMQRLRERVLYSAAGNGQVSTYFRELKKAAKVLGWKHVLLSVESGQLVARKAK